MALCPSRLATLLAVASLPDGAAGDAAVAECAVDVADDADDAAVARRSRTLAADRGLRRLSRYTDGGSTSLERQRVL